MDKCSKKTSISELIIKFNEVHNHKYKYSLINDENYKNSKSKIPIICEKHGIFEQVVGKHLRGQGCSECYGNKKKTIDEFKKEAEEVHGKKYIYDESIYDGLNKKIKITCSIHGEFWQTPKLHLRGQGCPECAKIKMGLARYIPFNEYVERANKVHNNRYKYLDDNYKGASQLVTIVCSEHGEFQQNGYVHLTGCGCPKCGKKQIWETRGRLTKEDFVKRAVEVHKKLYDYADSEFKTMNTPIKIKCNKCNRFFEQTPGHHIYGKCGCPYCASTYQPTTEEFVEKAKSINNSENILYDKIIYTNAHTKVNFYCKKHGDFWMTPNDFLNGCSCPSCGNTTSRAEIEIFEFIKNNCGYDILQRDKIILKGNELDIYIPEYKFAIEYNGLRWHSEQFNKYNYYHLNKLNECNKQGIRLIHIFEDEYLEHKDIVLSKIKHLLKKDDDLPKIQARKCNIKEINNDVSKNFLEKNHIQGFATATIYLGCYYNNELIAVMTFKKENKDNNKWELNRFATDITKHCIGVGGKLFKYFIKNYNPEYIKSFADRRWTVNCEDNLYTKLGFKLEETLRPDYRYVNRYKREHKFGYRKQILMKKYPDAGLTMDMTEKEMCDKLGFYRIWDCGLFKFVWKKE